jgi:N-acetylglucosamine-6-sulfatase
LRAAYKPSLGSSVSISAVETSRRTGAAAVVLALAVAAGVTRTDGAAAPTGGAARPNVVVIMTDDQTVESVRAMTNVRALLAGEGVTFANSFASYALCCPSRATFLSGQYAHNHGVMGNQPPLGGSARLDHANTLAVWLQRAGYRTVHVGKFLNGYGRDATPPVPPGWTEWYGSVDPSTYRFFGYTLNENGALRGYGTDPASYQGDVYAAKAVELVQRLTPQSQPFFLSLAFLAPHSGGPREPGDPANQATPVPAPRHRNRFASEPLPQPPSFNEADVSDKPAAIGNRRLLGPRRIAAVRENYQQRLESLLAVDEAVARVVAALRAAGELDRTLIVFTSDNGFLHGEHRIPSGKVVVYEPSVRVPLILRGPGVARGRVQRDLVTNVDLAATILDAANAKAGRRLDGRSLLPLARDRNRRYGRDVLLETSSYSAIRTPRFKYVEHRSGEQELYDLAADPDELVSRHGDPVLAELKAELARRLARLRTCSGASCRATATVRLAVRYRAGRARCVRSRLAVRITGGDVRQVVRTDFRLAGRRIRADVRAPFTADIAKRRLNRRSAKLLRVLVVFADGRELTLDRRLRSC